MWLLVSAACIAAAPGASVEVVFTGDVIPHEAVKETARRHARAERGGRSLNHDGWDHVFGPLAETFRAADAAVINLETPLTTALRPRRGELVFSAPPALAHALAAVGVTVATFANNHARDQSLAGITETRRHLAEAGLIAVGAADNATRAWEPACWKKNGLNLCVLAFTRFLNGQRNEEQAYRPHVPIVDYDLDRSTGGISERRLLEKVREVAGRCDALFVTPHWGEEYFAQPLQADRRLAHAMIAAGAVAVVGNHPHVLQAVETLERSDGRQGLIAYSLGNLVSSQGEGDLDPRRDGLLLSLTVAGSAAGTTVNAVRAIPVWTDNRGKAGIQPVIADDEISAMRERLRALELRTDTESRAEEKTLRMRLSKAITRRERILGLVAGTLNRPDPVTAELAAGQ